MTLQLLQWGSQAATKSLGGIIPVPLSLSSSNRACRNTVVWWIEQETLGAFFLSHMALLSRCFVSGEVSDILLLWGCPSVAPE